MDEELLKIDRVLLLHLVENLLSNKVDEQGRFGEHPHPFVSK